MKTNTRKKMGIVLVLVVVLLGYLLWRQYAVSGEEDAYKTDSGVALEESLEATSSDKNQSADTSKKRKEQECAVYIVGAVKKPGIYRYYGQSRVCDAIEAVGGFSKSAAREAVNLAQILEDGQQITIPTKKEFAAAKKKTTSAEKGSDSSTDSALINVNSASIEELMTLPGVGQAKAALIVEYRTEHGSFSKKEDLMKISGIKEGIYNKVKDLITI